MRLVSIQIPTWLRHPELWRFVGFVSTIVALLSYALTSSFNYLFGNWNLTKLIVYIVLSIIICLATLFPKVWQHSPSLLFRAHMAFVVLTITSVYSFFFDKEVNGKPGAYSLISCVAFAMMSLSLSRQIHCGFEVDLLYFFLGALIVQLMKINKLLVMVGICFSYFLVILQSSLDPQLEDDYLRFQVQEQNLLVVQVDSQHPNTNNSVLVTQFMASIEELQQRNPVVIQMILEHVKEFSEDHDDSAIGLVSDKNWVLDSLPSGIIDKLHEAAKSTAPVGLEKEFLDAFSSCRKECLEECLSRLLKLEEINENRKKLLNPVIMIGRWSKIYKVALKILLPSERRLCDRVFFGLSSTADLCFMEICGQEVTQLLNFANVLANESLPLNGLLATYRAWCDMIVDFKSLFCDSQTVYFVKEAVTIQNWLREAISISYKKARNSILQNNMALLDDPICRVHLITCKILCHINFCCRSRKLLEPILQEHLKGDDGAGTGSSFSEEMVSILEQLETRLIANFKNYEDPAMVCLFMMKNRRFIENEIKLWDLGRHLSNEWIQNNRAKIRQDPELFYRSSWKKVLDHLKLDKESLTPKVAAKSMIEQLILFNTHFTEMCSVQSTWFVADEQLREEIITFLQNNLVPAYGDFIGRFLEVIPTNAYEYIKYGMFDIEARLKDLFQMRRK